MQLEALDNQPSLFIDLPEVSPPAAADSDPSTHPTNAEGHPNQEVLGPGETYPGETSDFEALKNVGPGGMLASYQHKGQIVHFQEGSTTGDIIATLAKKVPSNDYGLPLFYYRSDLLPLQEALTLGYLQQSDIDMAATTLMYDEGYPTLKSGAPFWTQMEHEPITAYTLFKEYLALAETGIRLMDDLSRSQGVDLQRLRGHYNEFYWSSRARAYDLFVVAADQKKREHRIRNAENKHYETAGMLIEKLLPKFQDAEFFDGLNAKEAIDVMETLVKIQRLSLGLTGQQASTNQSMPNPGTSTEVILRSLTKNSGLPSQAQDALQNRISLLMQNPDDAMQLQELVIRTTSSGGN